MNATSENRLAFLDSLRGIAAAWVVLYHMIYIPVPNLDVPAWAMPWASIGGIGVTLFFMVSAFSLCYTMPFHQRELNPLRSFYIRRFFRIAPLFYVLLAFTLLRDKFVYGSVHDSATIAESVLFLFNLIPNKQAGIVWASWTVGVEMVFYLFFPLLYLWAKDAFRACIFVLIALALAIAFKFSFAYDSAATANFFQMSVLRHLPIFALGIAVFRFYEQFGRRKDVLLHLALLVIILSLFWASAIALDTSFGDAYYFQGPWFAALLLGLAFFPLYLIVNKATMFLGKLSYSLYLIHPPLILFMIPIYRQVYAWPLPLSLKYVAAVAMTFAALVSLSYMSYRFIEAPGIRVGKRIARDRRPSPALVAAQSDIRN